MATLMCSSGRYLLLLVICSACEGRHAPLGSTADAASAVCPLATTSSLAWPVCVSSPAACAPGEAGADGDGDGASALAGDCDDRDAHVGPGAAEVCDLRDNDCDGAVDEAAGCPDPATGCPISYPELHVCGERHALAGTFTLPRVAVENDAGPPFADGFATPFEVLLRRRETGEVRRALTCAAPPETPEGYPFRFRLVAPDFVQPSEEYEVIAHLRWYVSALADPASWCFRALPVVTTDGQTASAWVDLGVTGLWCL